MARSGVTWKVDWHGAEIAARFHAAAALLIAKTVKDAEARTKALIQEYDAIDTGNMLNSVTSGMNGPLTGWWASPAPYSIYVDMGTIHMAARPFFSGAYTDTEATFKADLARLVGHG